MSDVQAVARLLFACTHNSARSILANCLVNLIVAYPTSSTASHSGWV
jgi:protein-tyrosine-phosphatase